MQVLRLLKIVSPIICISICLFSCFDSPQDTQVGWGDEEYEIAVPLINSRISVAKIADISKGNTSLLINPDGKVSVIYNNNNVLSKNASAILPPFPGLIPYVLSDTVSVVKLPVSTTQLVKKAIFKDTKINFYLENGLPSDVKVKMKILELTKNNIVFEKEFSLKFSNSIPVKLQTEQISLDGWTYRSESNTMTFQYDAVLSNGKKIKLDHAFMNFDVLKFSYIEGYLGFQTFPVEGNFIDVGLFNQWLSGSFDFEDPKITISVDNSFGIPVRSNINKLQLTSVTGKTVNLQSPFIASGINYIYPSFNEIGNLKTTHFEFNKNNSNLRDIFNEKTKTISYDLNAIVNPEQDTTIKGYITNDSYFLVKVAVEVPLFGSLNKLVITDTLNIDLGDFDKVNSAEFKVITSNDFPAEIKLQAFFIDENNKNIDQLFKGEGISLPAAPLQANGITSPGQDKTEFIDFDPIRFNKIRNLKKLVVVGYLNTTGSELKKPLWIYDRYSLGMKVGAKLKYKP